MQQEVTASDFVSTLLLIRCRIAHWTDVLNADGIKLGLAERAGMFRLAQYGPINSLSIRKNEVMLSVQL